MSSKFLSFSSQKNIKRGWNFRSQTFLFFRFSLNRLRATPASPKNPATAAIIPICSCLYSCSRYVLFCFRRLILCLMYCFTLINIFGINRLIFSKASFVVFLALTDCVLLLNLSMNFFDRAQETLQLCILFLCGKISFGWCSLTRLES